MDLVEPRICEKGGRGFILPFSDAESTWSNTPRGVLYGIVMAYCFLGVSIVADTFMGAIEAMTSRRRRVRLKTGRIVTVRVWNDTVANLTLMALGSSAPEILLSVIELFKNEMYSGDLGPSTIVGSAAFNLLVIVPLCIVVIPNGGSRMVKELNVLYITVVFSTFAYIWLVVILSLITPDVVDFWEALVTFLAFPALVIISWMADTGKFGKLMRRRQNQFTGMEHGTELPDEILKKAAELEDHGELHKVTFDTDPVQSDPSTMDVEALVDSLRRGSVNSADPDGKFHARKSRAAHRIEATRMMTGGKKARRGSYDDHPGLNMHHHLTDATHGNRVMFMCDHQCLSRDLTEKPISLVRVGDSSFDVAVEFVVHYCTMDIKQALFVGVPMSSLNSEQANNVSAASNITLDALSPSLRSQYFFAGREVNSGTVTFQAGDFIKDIVIQRPTSAPPGHSEGFVVRLKSVKAMGSSSNPIEIGSVAMTHVSMTVAGAPGHIAFAQERLFVQGSVESQPLQAVVVRRGGCCGAVSVNFHTERLSGIPGIDYCATDGVLEFAEGVTEQAIELEILPKGAHSCADEFLVFLSECEGGAEFDPADDGGTEHSILTVTIGALDSITRTKSGHVLQWMDSRLINLSEFRLGARDWKEQVTSSIYCNGSWEDQAEASKMDWTFHLMSLPWKLLFTLVPPTSFYNGWVCFYTSLVMIGVVTGFIGDLAELFGCVFDVPDGVTAITFVALGTSMPDLFASHSAAIQDPYADASICNVTGSNSVNVFLGLGLPWTVGALHWNYAPRSAKWKELYPDVVGRCAGPNACFIVPQRNLGFSVLVFAGASLVALGLLQLRRSKLGYELGGPFKEKVCCALSSLILWLGYIALSSWQVLRYGVASDNETTTVFLAVIITVLVFPIYSVFLMFRYKAPPVEEQPDKAPSDEFAEQIGAAAPQDTDGDVESNPYCSYDALKVGIAPSDVAACILLNGSEKVSNEFEIAFDDRIPTQPPLTPNTPLDLMKQSSHPPESAMNQASTAGIPLNTRLNL